MCLISSYLDCCVMIICEGTCWKLVEIAMLGWVRHTHSVLGFCDDVYMLKLPMETVRDEG